MALTPAQIDSAKSLLQQHAQITSRLAQVNDTQTLTDVLGLLNGISPPGNALQQAQEAVTGYFQTQLSSIESQLTALGVSWS